VADKNGGRGESLLFFALEGTPNGSMQNACSRILFHQLLDEFEDVTPHEKKFTKLWNRYMKSHSVIADRDIPMKCSEFVRLHGKQVMDLGLRQELLLHFSGFWDNGIISSTHLMTLMGDADKYQDDLRSLPAVEVAAPVEAKSPDTPPETELPETFTPVVNGNQ